MKPLYFINAVFLCLAAIILWNLQAQAGVAACRQTVLRDLDATVKFQEKLAQVNGLIAQTTEYAGDDYLTAITKGGK